MMTFVSGRVSRIVRHASTPLPSGGRTSMRITTGFALAAVSIASAVVPASPTTTMSFCRPINVRSPSRTTSRSSTSITRTCGSAIPLLQRRQLQAYSRPLAGLTFHTERAADRERALAHVVQAVSARGRLEIEADAVVGDLQDDSTVLVEETDGSAPCACMAGDVPEGIRRDVVRGFATRLIETPSSIGRARDVDFDQRVRGCLVRQERQ